MKWFVTGTDTEVGKTVVTSCLAQSARGRGTVIAAKPVASGVAAGTAGEDAERIAAAAGHAPWVRATYDLPVSPHRAGLIRGDRLPPDLLAQVSALQADTVLVEGVGGWYVPLSVAPPVWVVDLARATGGRVWVVAANRLGVLNHTLLTLEAIRRDGMEVAAVVLNDGLAATPDDVSRRWNRNDLETLGQVPVLALPAIDLDDTDALQRAGDTLWQGVL